MKLKIGTQLILGFTFAVLVSVLIGYIGITNIHVIDDADTKLYQNMTVPLSELGAIQASFHQVRVNLRDMIRANDPAIIEQKAARIDELSEIINENTKEYEKTILTDEGRRIFKDFTDSRVPFRSELEKIKTLARLNKDADAWELVDGTANVAARTEQNAIEVLVKNKMELAKKTSDDNTILANRSSAIMITVIVIGALIAFLLGFLLSTGISNTIKNLIAEANKLTEAAVEGRLATRADAMKTNWEFRPIVEGVNKCLDAVIGPLNVAAEYVDRISKGDIPQKITDTYKGDFNEIKNNLNQCIDAVQLLVSDASVLSKAAVDGKLATRADASKHQGDFRKIVQGVNDTLDAVIGPLNVAAEYVDRISKGDIPQRITDTYHGDFNEIKNNLNVCIDSLNGLINEMNNMSNQHDLGDIDVKMDENKFQGSYKAMAAGVNNMVFGHIAVKKKAMACVKEFGEGNFDAVLEKFPGKKAFINDTIEQVRGNIKGLIAEMNNMSNQHDLGDIDVKMDENRFKGDFKKMAAGVNIMVFGHIAVKKKAMACVKAFGEGDFEAPLEKFPGKKVFINETIEQVRTNLKALIADANMLSKAAVEGKLATRADASKHLGDFRKIVQGVNDTLDAVIGPLNVAARYVDGIAKGDLPPMITDNYNGDFNTIKNNLNQLLDAMNQITAGARAMAAGDLTVTLKTRSDKDELMKALINMITNIRTMVQKIVESADQIAASSEELSKTAQNLSEGSQKQAASLEEASSSMEEMTSSVEQVANKAQNQASSVEEVTSSMEELNASIKGVADMSVKVKDGAQGAVNQAVGAEKSSEETNLAMKKIEESSIKISKIINVISDIADQTNLLALNASIEAARAGDAGRGFAVVAKEISKLADKSAGATKEIGDLITETNQNVKNGAEMVKVVDGAIKKIREVSEESARFGSEMANATEEQLTGSKQIAEAIQNVNGLAQSIASSAEEQSSTSSEMSKTIEKVNEITQHAASSAEEMASSTEELSSQAETLKKLAAQFKI